MLAKSKLDSIETLVSQALIDMEISHEEFITIFKKKDKYEKMNENLRNINDKLEDKTENMKLNSVNSRTEKYFLVYLISAKGYKNAEVDFLKLTK